MLLRTLILVLTVSFSLHSQRAQASSADQMNPALQALLPTSQAPYEGIFLRKHFLNATYQYPAEVRSFIVANIIVTYGRCFGLNANESILRASETDPICVQQLMEMFASPLFYGGFYTFMIGSRYGTPAAFNALKAISDYRERNGRRPMTVAQARFWAGQFGMAFGFMLDQSFHKIMENDLLHQCAAHTIRHLVGGGAEIDPEDVAAEKEHAELAMFRDPQGYCTRAYRQMLTSRYSKDLFSTGMQNLILSSLLNGVINPQAIRLGAFVVNSTGRATTTLLTPLITRQGAGMLVKVSGSVVRVGFAALGGLTMVNLVGFIAVGQLIDYYWTPVYRTITATFDFRNQVRDAEVAFKKLLSGQLYRQEKCPISYENGEELPVSGLCSRVPGVAELRTLHEYQTAWRQQKVLEPFNMAFYGWQTKWINFHTKVTATRDILRAMANFRELQQTGQAPGLQRDGTLYDQYFNEQLKLYAEQNGRDLEELRQRIAYLHENPELRTDVAYEDVLLFLYDGLRQETSAFESLQKSEPLRFLSGASWDEKRALVEEAFTQLRKEAFAQLSNEEKANAREIPELLKRGDLSEGRRQRLLAEQAKIESRLREIEAEIWLPRVDESHYFSRDARIDSKSPLAPEEWWSLERVREIISGYSQGSADVDETMLSYALLYLKKNSGILPQTNSKRLLASALKDFDPLYPYSEAVSEMQANYAQLAGYRAFAERQQAIAQGEEPPSSLGANLQPADRVEPYWPNAAGGPFSNLDLFDYIVSSALCKGRAQENLVASPQGKALDFFAPKLVGEFNYCDRAVSLDWWFDQSPMSVKPSLFLDRDGFYARGLMEAAIYDSHLPSYMNSEAQFNQWWNDSVLRQLRPLIAEMRDGYYKMVTEFLLSTYSDTKRENLQIAIEAEQVYSTFQLQAPQHNRLVANSNYYFYRDYLRDTFGSLFSDQVAQTNFRPNGNLLEAFANHFGMMTNYLALSMSYQFELSSAESFRRGQSWRPPELPVSLIQSEAQALERAELLGEVSLAFFPAEMQASLRQDQAAEMARQTEQALFTTIKNTKETFVDLLMDWDQVNQSKYEDSLVNLRNQLNQLAGFLVSSEQPLETVKSLANQADSQLVQDLVSQESLQVLRGKPNFVLLKQLDEIVVELEQLRSQRLASSFDFDLKER